MRSMPKETIVFSANFACRKKGLSNTDPPLGAGKAVGNPGSGGVSEKALSISCPSPESRLSVSVLYLPHYELAVDIEKSLLRITKPLTTLLDRLLRVITSDPPFVEDSGG